MKEYMKPELEYVKFATEDITDGPGTGTGDGVSNDFDELT